MESCQLRIPGAIFKKDFTIIYKGSEKDDLGEVKTSKEEFMRKLRYFNNKIEIKQQDELFIHDKYPFSIFRSFISSIETNTVNIDSTNCNYYYELSSKYQYNELQEEVKKYMQSRPDLQNFINQLSKQENENDLNSIAEKEEIVAQNLDACIQLGFINLLPIDSLIRVLNSDKRVLNDHCLLFNFIKDKILNNKNTKEYNKDQIQMLVNSLDLNKISIDEMEELINDFDIDFYINLKDSKIFNERKNMKKQIEQLNERINQLDIKFQQKITEFENIQNEQKKQISKLLSLCKQKEEEKDDDDTLNDKKIESFNEQYKGNPFSGIFDHIAKLFDNKNICDEGIISITGNNHQYSIPFSKLIDNNYNGVCYSSENQHNSYIRFDFKNHLVSVSAYTIKSSNQPDPDFMQSWVIEGSINLKNWINIDTHNYDNSLKANSAIRTFMVNNPNKDNFRYIQLRMTGPSVQGGNTLEISRFELFGNFI